MLYIVGSKIDLRDLNDSYVPDAPEPPVERYDTYIPGTKISFRKMVEGVMLMNVDEPAMRLSIAISR